MSELTQKWDDFLCFVAPITTPIKFFILLLLAKLRSLVDNRFSRFVFAHLNVYFSLLWRSKLCAWIFKILNAIFYILKIMRIVPGAVIFLDVWIFYRTWVSVLIPYWNLPPDFDVPLYYHVSCS